MKGEKKDMEEHAEEGKEEKEKEEEEKERQEAEEERAKIKADIIERFLKIKALSESGTSIIEKSAEPNEDIFNQVFDIVEGIEDECTEIGNNLFDLREM